MNKTTEELFRYLVRMNDWLPVLSQSHETMMTESAIWLIENDYAETDEDGYGLRWTGKIA